MLKGYCLHLSAAHKLHNNVIIEIVKLSHPTEKETMLGKRQKKKNNKYEMTKIRRRYNQSEDERHYVFVITLSPSMYVAPTLNSAHTSTIYIGDTAKEKKSRGTTVFSNITARSHQKRAYRFFSSKKTRPSTFDPKFKAKFFFSFQIKRKKLLAMPKRQRSSGMHNNSFVCFKLFFIIVILARLPPWIHATASFWTLVSIFC